MATDLLEVLSETTENLFQEPGQVACLPRSCTDRAATSPAARKAAGPRIKLFDIGIDNVTLEEAVEVIVDRLDGDAPTQVSFVNADCVNIACKSREYREALQESDLVFADGIGVRVAGEILGRPIRDNVNGTDLFPRLAAALQGSGKRVYLLGGRPGVADGVARWLAKNFPDVKLAGWRHGYFSAEEEAKVIADIRRCGADLVLVAFGAPRQELWIRRNLAKLGAKVVIGVGGLLDFFSGRIPRAPRWIRKLGLEWCYRLYQEPQRLWRRYLVGNVVFLARLARTRLAN
jgi:N-acetylglucosaminyldiphosphoundecaprenol N-acetyl-beta-D-mannosaminyltransferase